VQVKHAHKTTTGKMYNKVLKKKVWRVWGQRWVQLCTTELYVTPTL